MDTTALKKFAQGARRQLLEQVSARLEHVLRSDSVEIREKAKVVGELRTQIDEYGKKHVIDRVAYTWFNRFCALRFMDVNHYTRIGVVSPVEGGTQPEVLLEAKQGHIDKDLAGYLNPKEIFGLLNGQRPSSDAQGETYRLLLAGICKSYYDEMPFLFEKIEDYTELLMPLDLLSENSVLHDLREALTPEACQDVEVIGWLYQYYISERKDKVFEALKQNQKIEAGDIPAATQLFTPHWIVRYLVENSLGRLWMLNYPDSKLVQHMEYYISPAQEETDFLKVASPEELRLLDPACGSGHILTYAFDLLHLIYEETGYQASDIPRLILEKNLYGIEIDGRAGALAAFALTMKARSNDRRFLTRDIQPNICVLENVTFNDAELKQYMNAVGRDLFTEPLTETLRQFEQAENVGSLIRPMLTNASYVRGLLEGKNLGGNLFLFGVHERVMKVLKQAEFLAPRYHAVVTNPPYMNYKNMNTALQNYANDQFPNDSNSDLYSMFIERNFGFVVENASISMITMDSWMYGVDFSSFRESLLATSTILTLAHFGARAFDEISGEVVQTAAFVIAKKIQSDSIGIYFRLVGPKTSTGKEELFLTKKTQYRVAQNFFKYFPRSILAYYADEHTRNIFQKGTPLKEIAEAFTGLQTGDNDRFIRMWHEVSLTSIDFGCQSESDASLSKKRWFPYIKGSEYRKWYGNLSFVVDWRNNGNAIRKHKSSTVRNAEYYFKSGLAYNNISKAFCARYVDSGFIFDQKNSMFFSKNRDNLFLALGFLHSKIVSPFLEILSPKDFNPGSLKVIPIMKNSLVSTKINSVIQSLIDKSRNDWDSYEISWNFTRTPLIFSRTSNKQTVQESYNILRTEWQTLSSESQQLEEANNQIFIEAYKLDESISPSVPMQEISLACNPYYRYGNKRSREELEELLLADTMKEFISYAVGCMFGRFSLDKPGLVLANQGETLKDYLKQVPKPTFTPDEDNVIPVLEGEWFEDDIAERFKKFLRVTFGEEHYDENLAFIEESIGRDVRSYFVKEFYKDHVQTYKKRPIYWMFSSPKGSFNALIYMHRYQPDTVSIVLNNYLREYIKKLTVHKSQLERTSVSGSASQSQKTKALKDITKINKELSELKEYEDDVLYPLATEQVKIDLDDGVKVNYGKFGSALYKITGL